MKRCSKACSSFFHVKICPVKIYLDSAVATSWKVPPGCPPVAGVTTNPSLIFQAGLRVDLPTYLHLVHAAGERGLDELMLQLPSSDPAQALHWLESLVPAARQAGIRMTIKLPCHADWLRCIQAVKAQKVPILLTALSNPVQLLWAQSLKADFVAPYIGRLAAEGRDVWALVQACVAVQNDPTEGGPALLAASIKSPDVLSKLMAFGAAAVTLPPASLIIWSQDELTQAAMDQFDRDTVAAKRQF